MTEHALSAGTPSTAPLLADFLEWPSEHIIPLLRDKTVTLSTSGTSRWYFLEHGNAHEGYDTRQQFEHYGRRVIQRTLEIADMIFADGVRTLFIVGFGGGQARRDPAYLENMRWSYRMLVDEHTRRIYDGYDIGVLFRGDWGRIFGELGAVDLSGPFAQIEEETAGRERWLIWFVPDAHIPPAVVPLVQRRLAETGQPPTRQEMAAVYYGRPLDAVDILIGNNKPGVAGACPPLLTLRDLYFTVSPITYLERRQWRHVVYDHLFNRRGHFRQFRTMQPEALEEMRQFYTAHRDDVIGLGRYDPDTQTWRPLPFAWDGGG
ncbi:MAG TPA: hypothetical protein PK801_11280 [Aggregatilineales bacterium]|nr:hypothetical protein [Aggregatilineales bacterium]HPV06650.1 hypothetical protein [Aggregatilineales bacterium]HQA68899.1 hypothetical protein [Aggregatilineales bacterium]HQE17014.1 hypothetical protein [Aggregatilineales bacterium]